MLSGSRRKFLADAALAVAALAAGGQNLGASDPVLERLRSTLQVEPLDRDTMDGLEGMVVATARAYRSTTQPLTLRPVIRGLMGSVAEALQSTASGTPSHRRQLSLAAELWGLYGWIDWDAGNVKRAEESFTTGLEFAYQAGDKPLGAYLLACIGNWPLHVEDPERRLNVLSSNYKGITTADATPQVWAWVQALQAGAYAKSGRSVQFQRACDIVDASLWDAPGNAIRRPRVDFFDTAYWSESKATYLLLQGTSQARHVAEATQIIAEVLPSANGQIRIWLHVAMSEAFRQQREPEAAIEHAKIALTAARAGGIESIVQCLRDVPGKMADMRVAELDEFEELLSIA